MSHNERCAECGKMMGIAFMNGLCSQECIANWLSNREKTRRKFKKYFPRYYEIINDIEKIIKLKD